MKQPPCPKCGKPMTRGPKADSGNLRWVCREGGGARTYCHSTTNPGAKPREKRSQKTPVFARTVGKSKTRLLVTAAQNGTPAHPEFMKTLEVCANKHSADIVVIPLRYKNPTSRWTASQSNDEVWADEVQPYLLNQRKRLNKNLVLLADIKTQPTASDPLTGFDAITHAESGILGHTKLRLRTVPVPQGRMPKILTTTGACTKPNFTDSKAGKLGEFHYTLGAALVELDGPRFHLRQINADKRDGSFIDLTTKYWTGGIVPNLRAESLATGDLHSYFTCQKALAATKDQIAVLRPKVITWDDVCDMHTVTPHHKDNPFAAIAKMKSGRTNPHDELKHSIDLVASCTPDDAISYITFSNHPEMLARWARSADWKQMSPENARFYLDTVKMMLDGTQMTDIGISTPDPFIYWGRKHAETTGKDIRFLELDESLMIADVEHGMHGHKGTNGARGSARNLRRIGVRSWIRHVHAPCIDEGCYALGTLTRLFAEYTAGPSGWLNTNGATYESGKRSLLNIIDGEWRSR